MTKHFFILIILGLIISCTPKEKKTKIPENVIVQEQMVSVLVDFHLAEAALMKAEREGRYTQELANQYYYNILKKHNITAKKFNESLKFYSSNLRDFHKIYQEVVTELSKTQSRIISK